MHRRFTAVVVVALALVLGAATVTAQGTLSNQVLALLSRVNTWIGTQTFNDLRMANTSVPSVTAFRLYADTSGNLYFNGGLIAGSGGGSTPHNLLSSTHPDTLAAAVVRGSIIVGNATPKWAALAIGANHTVFVSNGTDAAWGTDGSGLTGILGSSITGTLAAVSGVNLTNLNGSNIASGTVPAARLGNITNTQIDAAAAITYTKLSLTNGIVNADINSAAAIAYSKLNLGGLVATQDIAASAITFAKWNANGCTASQFSMYNGGSWVCRSLVVGDVSGAGTVTSVALSLPAIFSLSGSPIVGSGTFAATLASQTQNLVFASPNGGSGAPGFRALVNADLPTSGVAAGTYNQFTVNAQGIVTAATTAFAAGTITTSQPISITQTWNAGGVTFNGFLVNITDSASAAASLLEDLQVGGVSKWKVSKAGNVTATGTGSFTGAVSSAAGLSGTTGTFSGAVSMTALTASTGTFSGLVTANLGVTVPTAQIATITDTDALLVGSNKIPNTLTFTCAGLSATSVSGDCEFVADRAYQVTAIKFVQKTAGGAGCVGDIEKLTGTTTPGSGTVMGTGSYDCNATANNTVTTYTLTGTVATLQLAAGNRMGIKLGGTLTSLAGLTATVTLKAI